MNPETPKSHGHPLTVAAVVGSFALAVGLVVKVSGVMTGAEQGLIGGYLGAGFLLGDAPAQPWWSVMILPAVVLGLALLLLEIPGTGRRVMVAVTLLVLVGGASPVLALWGVFWSPFVALLSGAWSAFCAIMWAAHHPMPCEVREELGGGNVISLKEESQKVGKSKVEGQ